MFFLRKNAGDESIRTKAADDRCIINFKYVGAVPQWCCTDYADLCYPKKEICLAKCPK